MVIWALEWRHDERDSVTNHRRLDGLLNHLFRRRSRITSKLRVTGLCEGNSLPSCVCVRVCVRQPKLSVRSLNHRIWTRSAKTTGLRSPLFWRWLHLTFKVKLYLKIKISSCSVSQFQPSARVLIWQSRAFRRLTSPLFNPCGKSTVWLKCKRKSISSSSWKTS